MPANPASQAIHPVSMRFEEIRALSRRGPQVGPEGPPTISREGESLSPVLEDSKKIERRIEKNFESAEYCPNINLLRKEERQNFSSVPFLL